MKASWSSRRVRCTRRSSTFGVRVPIEPSSWKNGPLRSASHGPSCLSAPRAEIMDIMSNTEHTVHLVELRDVTKTYPVAGGHFTALGRVALRLPRGACVAIVGKSGRGKTTLLNLVA